MRVLIAEDDRISRRMLQRQLEKWGHEVVSAEDGAQAWEQLEQGEFSIVISDWMMPVMDGLELVRRIREQREQHYVYIILLTAKTETDDIVEGMNAGADDFLSKPFDKQELRVRVRAGERIIELERNLADRNAELQDINERMSKDLRAAARVQQSLLPSELPELPGVQLAWSFRPCDELAGDFLNVFALDDKHLALYVADVSGHGVVASLLSVTISRVLSAQAGASSVLTHTDEAGQLQIVSPVEVIQELNRRFPMDDVGMYFTLVYGILNVETRQFQYCSAGHPPILRVAADGQINFLEGEGFAVGWDLDYEFAQNTITLQPGDRLLLYSDGVPEAMNGQLEPFQEQRLVDNFLAQRSADLQSAVDSLRQAVEQWCEPAGPKDDVSILAMDVER